MMSRLSAEQCTEAIKQNDFPGELTASREKVVFVLTQSWCPQWSMMQSWLARAADEAGADVYFSEYDRETFFDEFMQFKETTFGNRSIPYLRYYRDGKLAAESNYVSKDVFVKNATRNLPS